MTYHRVPNGFSGSGISLILTSGSRFQGKILPRFGIERIAGGRMRKVTIGITGLKNATARLRAASLFSVVRRAKREIRKWPRA